MKKLKETTTDSYQAKIEGKMLRKRENKLSLRFVHSRRGRENSKKIEKKFKKLKNTITTSFQAKICWKKAKKERK